MLFQLDLFVLLLAPVATYLAAAFGFSLLSRSKDEHLLPVNASSIHYRSGHKL